MIHDFEPMGGGPKTKSRLECRHWNLGEGNKKGKQLYITESIGIYMANKARKLT